MTKLFSFVWMVKAAGHTVRIEENEEKHMTETLNDSSPNAEGRFGSCLLWVLWGGLLGFMTIFSLVLLALLAASVMLNVYLGWELSGLEVAISRRSAASPAEVALLPTSMLATIPTQTPVPTGTATPLAVQSPVEIQLATLSALATEVVAERGGSTPGPPAPVAPPTPLPPLPTMEAVILPPTAVPPAVAITTPLPETVPLPQAPPPAEAAAAPVNTPAAAVEAAQEFAPPPTSSNSYALIPIEGDRESRPAAEHGDLNLKLREPEPIEVELNLVEIPGSGIDPNAPQFSKVFEPNFVRAYTIHDWDWGCNCKGKLLREDNLVLAGVKTTAGQPVFIPPTGRDIYDGKYYAVVLYADEDSLTFLYARAGSVVKGYTVHYLGFKTDPNLVKLFRESKGNELPGLSPDTPVGTATDELIVAIRDNGKFLDARSKKDWWN